MLNKSSFHSNRTLPIVLGVLLLALQTVQLGDAHAANFGQDDRRAITPSSPAAQLARSTAVSILTSNATLKENGKFDLNTNPLPNFCSDEAFAKDPSLTYSCTGFLVAPDLLVTAGHCVYAVNTPNSEIKDEPGLACAASSWLFDYQRRADGSVQLQDVDADRMYKCKRIIYAVQQEKAPYLDYALIQLDRPVIDRPVLKIATFAPTLNAPVSMIGYPFGTPSKLSDHARVLLNNPARNAFITNLDAFEGNSGSPVFNSSSQVVGILISGTPQANTYTDKTKQCERTNRCDDFGHNCVEPDQDTSLFPGFQITGSDVQRIEPIRELLNSRGIR